MKQSETQFAAFVVGLALCFVGCFVLGGSYLAGQLADDSFAIESRVNPNTADMASLMLLPGLGPSKAADIIEYRKKFADGGVAFEEPSDLYAVSGLGPATVDKMSGWLRFE